MHMPDHVSPAFSCNNMHLTSRKSLLPDYHLSRPILRTRARQSPRVLMLRGQLRPVITLMTIRHVPSPLDIATIIAHAVDNSILATQLNCVKPRSPLSYFTQARHSSHYCGVAPMKLLYSCTTGGHLQARWTPRSLLLVYRVRRPKPLGVRSLCACMQ